MVSPETGIDGWTPDLERIAYAVGRVIADKTIESDRGLMGLDGLGKASARHDLATRMVPMLMGEAEAAADELVRQLKATFPDTEAPDGDDA